MANPLARDVPTERLISLKFRSTHEESLRDAIQEQNSYLFFIVAERVLAPLRESLSRLSGKRGWGEAKTCKGSI